MAEQEQEQRHKEEPIIIKKKKGHGGHGHHGGAWKVAYADFVTAMMAFFIVMWILASSQEVKEAVSSYFNDPGAFNFLTGERTIPVDLGLTPPQGKGGDDKNKSGTQKVVISFNPEMRDSIISGLMKKAEQDSVKAAELVAKTAQTLQNQINQLVGQNPELKEILSSIKIELTKEGLRIELIESTESLFFEIGSSKLKPKASELLQNLASEIGKLANSVEIEGHTDSRAYMGKGGYSNWELSSDRANAARRILEKGLWEGQIARVTGFGDRKLRTPDNPFDVTNRRVSILIKQRGVSEFVPTNQQNQ